MDTTLLCIPVPAYDGRDEPLTVILTEAEEQILQQLLITHPCQDMRTRAAALLMPAGDKLRSMGVHAKPDVRDQLVHNWAYTWREQGMIGLLVTTGHKGRRAAPRFERRDGRGGRAHDCGRAADARVNRPASRNWIRTVAVRASRYAECGAKVAGFYVQARTICRSKKRGQKACAGIQAALDKLQQASRENTVCPFYLDKQVFVNRRDALEK
ncbi:MAG: hypothetical protein PCALPYG88_7362 [uncultured Paraburkholderia sp.]|nr:MAG: hypothetical protein PCALPYG08_7359 [uncultured Paraburkholderia sp.]CAH2943720.1 MAG: hypothetical protein PCALPYG88_7362 [uncultured Paraburkholderia sp.]